MNKSLNSRNKELQDCITKLQQQKLTQKRKYNAMEEIKIALTSHNRDQQKKLAEMEKQNQVISVLYLCVYMICKHCTCFFRK